MVDTTNIHTTLHKYSLSTTTHVVSALLLFFVVDEIDDVCGKKKSSSLPLFASHLLPLLTTASATPDTARLRTVQEDGVPYTRSRGQSIFADQQAAGEQAAATWRRWKQQERRQYLYYFAWSRCLGWNSHVVVLPRVFQFQTGNV